MLKRKTVNSIFILGLIVLVGLSFFLSFPWYIFLLVGFIWFLLTLFGSFFVRWNYHLVSLHSNKSTTKNEVAITFDDGPNSQYTPMALELLKKYDARATFFCIGKHIEKHPELFKQIIREGHTVGNHTFSHDNTFGFYGTSKVAHELSKSIDLVEKLVGLKMRLYRPAFGVTNPSIAEAVNKLGLISIGWNVRSLDTTPRNEKMVLKRITTRTNRGDIILLHDTSAKSIAVLERLLLFLKEKNLKSVTVDQLLELKAYV
ncbi:polysaccharide deacetylase family protein [Maribacter sp. PR1]|uniref:Polysaccharide deacetylase family protein n=1 Tax=Maribacter cobaltidurans TaxID=1178778 RepID=A0ABU7IQ70_9FLAO|nr:MULTISPECIES: polysaccharide deacetylase family protein [Maribacter]MDC6387641.1 polysaccharide deacetylase family protein [Maribacter sp. PR1]MEE1975029.1 polysaccharide deacetylase family protein [Maribacter cobaltidurans]